MRVLLLGISGGIGKALADKILRRYPSAKIIGVLRHGSRFEFDHSRVELFYLDPASEKEVSEFCMKLEGIDWYLNAIGLLHNKEGIKPEKSLRDFSIEKSLESFKVNTLMTVLWAKYLKNKFSKKSESVFCTLSAKVGSTSDNYLGGWYSYRASKAALNMMLKTIKIEYSRSKIPCKVLGIHPGTTKTQLSEPFLSHSRLKLWEPLESAKHIIDVIEGTSLEDKEVFYNWTGERLEY